MLHLKGARNTQTHTHSSEQKKVEKKIECKCVDHTKDNDTELFIFDFFSLFLSFSLDLLFLISFPILFVPWPCCYEQQQSTIDTKISTCHQLLVFEYLWSISAHFSFIFLLVLRLLSSFCIVFNGTIRIWR